MGGAHCGGAYIRGGRAILALGPEYPEELALIACAVYDEVLGAGLAANDSRDIALAVVERVRQMIGGAQFYVPMGHRLNVSERRRQVMAHLEAKPGDYAGAARAAGCAGVTARRIEREMRAFKPGSKDGEP